MHIHMYEYREHMPRNEIARSRLAGRPKQTFDSVDEAMAWYAQWLNDTARPPSYWGADGETVRKPHRIGFTRSELELGSDVVDGFWSGGGYIEATLIPCPVRKAPGYPSNYPCPIGRG